MLKDALNFFMEILFPPVCGNCGKLNKNWICEKCYRRLSKIKKVKIQTEFNTKEIFYNKLLYIFLYENIIRNLILQYKFNNKAYVSNLFSTIILKDNELCRKINYYDIIIPVPMFEKKEKQRGYNQTELITEKICQELNIKLEANCVIKIKNTKVQSLLNAQERKQNIKNAFFVNNKDKIKDKNIIIFDDIFTTGETANEISRVLKLAGAKEILVLVLAKD